MRLFRMRGLVRILCFGLVTSATSFVVGATAAPGDLYVVTTAFSYPAAGSPAQAVQEGPALSANGTRVAFWTTASLLPIDSTTNSYDVYLEDLTTSTYTLVSTTDSGVPANTSSLYPAISGDGTKIAFESHATNLDTADTDNRSDIYVKNTTTGDVSLVSINGTTPLGGRFPSISADGTRIAFVGGGGDYGPIWVRDTIAGTTTQVTAAPSTAPAISGDGSKVAYSASNSDLYVEDIASGTLTLGSSDALGVAGNGQSGPPSLSSDGHVVTFHSYATNLDPSDATSDIDVFRKDLVTGAISLITSGLAGAPSTGSLPTVSANGLKIAYQSGDAWVTDTASSTSTVVSTDATGTPVSGGLPAISADGLRVAFGGSGRYYVKEIPLASGGVIDADADGVDDAIDTGVGTFSDGTTFGAIVDDAGYTVLVTDAVAPDGVHVTVTGSGTAKAVFSACGFGTIRLAPGSDIVLTCGSVKLNVTTGSAEVELGGGITTVSIPAGAIAEVSDLGAGKFSVQNQQGSTAPVTVTTNGVASTVAAGSTWTVPVVTIGNLCALTKQDVQGSARYKALTVKQKQGADALANAACSILQAIGPKLNAKQKAALVTAYVAVLPVLVQAGWLTQEQKTTLAALAATL